MTKKKETKENSAKPEKPAKALTSKQEAFVRAVVEGKTQSEAYLESYDVGPDTKIESVQQAASRIMRKPEIQARLRELREPAAIRARITLEGHLDDLLRLRLAAEQAKNFPAAIQAEIARGKHSGVTAAEKVDVTMTHAEWLAKLA